MKLRPEKSAYTRAALYGALAGLSCLLMGNMGCGWIVALVGGLSALVFHFMRVKFQWQCDDYAFNRTVVPVISPIHH